MMTHFSIGSSAQYCNYITKKHDSMDIINVVTVKDKRQTDQNSVAMGEHTVIKTIVRLLQKTVTDARFFFSICSMVDWNA